MGLIFDDFFSDNMVLPKNKKLKLGGKVEAYANVTVTIDQKTIKTTADENGEWKAFFETKNQSERTLTLIGKSADVVQIVRNVHLGKVYLFAGQSNIEYKLKDEFNFKNERNIYENKSVYFINIPQIEFIDKEEGSILPSKIKKGQWKLATRENIGEMSAIAFYASKILQRTYDEPIGIVDCYKGGTSISCWLPLDLMKESDSLRRKFIIPFENEIQNKNKYDFDKADALYEEKVAVHQKKIMIYQGNNVDKTLSEVKEAVGHTPWPPPMRPESYLRPGGLYQTMISQIRYSAFNKVIWYQGENDVENSNVYEELLVKLITTWRGFLCDRLLPFIIVQLPRYLDGEKNTWAKIRQIQLLVTKKLPYVKLCSIVDTGEEHNIHPMDKRKPGTRIGNVLTEKNYIETPSIDKISIQDGFLLVNINNSKRLNIYMNTVVKIITKSKEVEHELVLNDVRDNVLKIKLLPDTRNVEYAYDNFPRIGIFNELGWPVTPFKVDIIDGKARLNK